MDLEKLLLLSIAQVEAKRTLKSQRYEVWDLINSDKKVSDFRLIREAQVEATAALARPGRYGQYLKRHALKKLEEISK